MRLLPQLFLKSPVLAAILALAAAASPASADSGSGSSGGAHINVNIMSDDDRRLTGNGSISHDHGALLIRVDGYDPARVGADGALSIGGTAVAVDAGGRRLLAKYHADADTVSVQARALAKQGVHFALHTVAEVLSGLVTGTVDEAGAEAEAGSHKIEVEARGLCMMLDQWHSDQQAAAVAVPEFRPYASISSKDVSDCYAGMKDEG
jgi:autotransporter translocation and assembly factor TamB